jgi:hypothetical protein
MAAAGEPPHEIDAAVEFRCDRDDANVRSGALDFGEDVCCRKIVGRVAYFGGVSRLG